MKRTLLSAAFATLIATPTFAGIITVTAPDRLATIVEGAPNTTYKDVFTVGYGGGAATANRPVFSFNVSDLTLPANGYDVGTSTVNQLKLTLKTTTGSSWAGGGSVSFDLKLWATDPVNTNWDSNYVTLYKRNATQNWAGTAYNPNAGYGSLGTPLTSQTVTSTASGQTVTFTSTDSTGLTALINSWLSGSNAGLFMATQYTANNRYLIMVPTGADAPELEITFTNVPEPGTFAMLLFGSVMLWVVKRKRG